MTCEVRVGQSYIKKALGTRHLYPLFQSHVLLDMFLNVENKLVVMAGSNSDDVVYVLCSHKR